MRAAVSSVQQTCRLPIIYLRTSHGNDQNNNPIMLLGAN